MVQNMDNISGQTEHILVCLSSAPSNPRIINTAKKMADAFNGRFTALFVETPDHRVASKENKERLLQNIRLAEELGAKVEIAYGTDTAWQIAEFVRLNGVSKVVLGRSTLNKRRLFEGQNLTQRLLSYAPEVDIHIIPDSAAQSPYHPRKNREQQRRQVLPNMLKSLLILTLTTAGCVLLRRLGMAEGSVVPMYIVAVLIISVVTAHPLYSLASSAASVFIFNYIFIAPHFSMDFYEKEYAVTFLVMFIAAYITGTLAIRYKEQARTASENARRTSILFDTDRLLSRAESREEIFSAAAGQIQKLLKRSLIIFELEDDVLGPGRFFPTERGSEKTPDMDVERSMAELAMGEKNLSLQTGQYLYLPMSLNDRLLAMVGIDLRSEGLDVTEHGILQSILSQCALALENERNAREKEQAAILAKSEQLRANLLRSLSHDLRTPLTSIYGNAGNLLHRGSVFDEETRQQMYADIHDDSLWLIRLVESLLYTTRIEDGRMNLNFSPELLGEIVSEAMHHIDRSAQEHRISIDCEDELLMVRADGKLMMQVIINLVNNAVKYTPPGSHISVSAYSEGKLAYVRVADDGPGIPDREKDKIFDKFYCGEHKIADHRRSLGLGLYLCKVIVEAHGGSIRVEDNVPQGTVFSFSLPLEELDIYE